VLARIYEWIYTRIGGRPWTEIVREEQKRAPLLFLLIFLGLGILVAKLAGKYWWQILIGFILGILCGHFWW
jgi:predicted MFS family arabinose efflux permease